MGQIFQRSVNRRLRRGLWGAGILLVALLVLLPLLERAPWITHAGRTPAQPVAFSHRRHVREVGVDCRYCHGSVEVSGAAAIPPTRTCVNCHAYLKSSPQLLEPVRLSWVGGAPLVWKRVYKLAGYVYFNHDIHVSKGVGCVVCHGHVDRMQRTEQFGTLQMAWCLDCHRNPAASLRPRSEVFNVEWKEPSAGKPIWCAIGDNAAADCTTTAPGPEGRGYRQFTSQDQLGGFLRESYRIRSGNDLSSCEVCHR